MKSFLIIYTVFALVASAFLIVYPKEELFLIINGAYSGFGDVVFPYITYLGGGFFSALTVIIFLFIQYRLAIIASVSFILMGLITQVLKHTLFSDCPRPFKFFEGGELVHSIADVDLYLYNSFPSGHSATAFSLFFMLVLALKGKQPVWGIVFFFLALLGGYSRIYLGQHFLGDVLAGSFIGVITTYLCYVILDKHLASTAWANRSLKRRSSYE